MRTRRTRFTSVSELLSAEQESFRADLQLALSMADRADVVTMKTFQSSSLRVETKPDLTPVTEADQATEQLLREILSQERPLDEILGEEFGETSTASNRRWVLDPIDGTKNYVRGVPVWSTLIALTIDGVPVLGVVSAPALNRRWWAAKNAGAWTRALGAEPKRIGVSGVHELSNASFSYSDAIGWPENGALTSLNSSTWRQRAYGDFWSHMLVAEGAVDVSAEPELGAWDMAALIPIIEEAGGKATAFDGGPALRGGSLVATNGLLHDQVLPLLQI
ncbi:MAG: histidinol-phosphatase [Actinobacteria bacterium]|uniref:histidinol-phosphatase n=1 Tax=freshwater metagenome TaxID=449393 RepID=A0A6J7F7T1_9ZZZZ|nr:histidinol-phosphatase [Actinomycetota bacterium]